MQWDLSNSDIFSLLFHECDIIHSLPSIACRTLQKVVNRLICTYSSDILLSSAYITGIWLFALRATFIKIFSSDADQRKMGGGRITDSQGR